MSIGSGLWSKKGGRMEWGGGSKGSSEVSEIGCDDKELSESPYRAELWGVERKGRYIRIGSWVGLWRVCWNEMRKMTME